MTNKAIKGLLYSRVGLKNELLPAVQEHGRQLKCSPAVPPCFRDYGRLVRVLWSILAMCFAPELSRLPGDVGEPVGLPRDRNLTRRHSFRHPPWYTLRSACSIPPSGKSGGGGYLKPARPYRRKTGDCHCGVVKINTYYCTHLFNLRKLEYKILAGILDVYCSTDNPGTSIVGQRAMWRFATRQVTAGCACCSQGLPLHPPRLPQIQVGSEHVDTRGEGGVPRNRTNPPFMMRIPIG